jgi:hypothetical protein
MIDIRSMKLLTNKTFRALACVVMLVTTVSCNRPPARIVMSGNTATVNVETLGEYPTTIMRARLRDEVDRSIIWEIQSSDGTPQIHKLVLKLGSNSATLANPTTGKYRVIVPTNSDTFELSTDRQYKLELWDELASGPASVDWRFGK